ncbi:diguanylate cyclase (GGDEF)-like protein [Psychrobacillus insolitus]|uniref:Diguanylate cyclase (GGDEF)-like protein n=1 Tax=Psychrobacillus insolitus TaxID=1461 RepID=A0A2W7ML14_9BACI|nr:diguanylate cyclase (GGDEF)-like protein [Psychrobacillus insolitus]
MKLFNVTNNLSVEKQKMLEWQMFYENIQRSKLLAKIVILFEVFLIIMNISSSEKFLNIYVILYITLLFIATVVLLFALRFEKGDIYDEARYKKYQKGLFLLVFLFLLWGSVVTLVDQLGYGHIMAFVVNVMCVSVLLNTSYKLFFWLYTIPTAVLVVGLPFFQASSEVLIGHYVNLSVFLFFCWLVSRMLYMGYYRNFYNKVLLEEMNEELAFNIDENVQINRRLEQANEQLKQLTLIDELSKIPNRRGLYEYIHKYLSLADSERCLSIIMIDIDYFKQYNDLYGHVEGDKVIQSVAQQLNASIDRTSSLAVRYGGEEFIVAAFDMKEAEAYQLAERIRLAVEEMKIPHELSPISSYLSISLGLATNYLADEGEIELLIQKADQALYEAKKNGRNLVEVSEKMN